MDVKPIHNDDNLQAALARIEALWGALANTPQGDELEILSILVEKYESERYPLQVADPVEAIKFIMDQQGLTQSDLEPFIGSSHQVSEVLNRKRKLSLAMIRRLHEGLRIPYECLLAENT